MLKEVHKLSHTDTARKWKSWDNNLGWLQSPWSITLQIKEIIITNSSILPELLIERSIPWRPLISLGNFQQVQKNCKEDIFLE